MGKLLAITGVLNYLVVVFLNAFTDLGHKIIIQNTIFKVYDGETQIILTAVVNALILLPFILVFSPSGFIADRFYKNSIMRYSALFAVFITLVITFSYYQGWFVLAFFMTFLLALQSAIYSPAKYGYIKELVPENYITSLNGATQAVTTVAILGGIIFYTVLFENFVGDEFNTKETILTNIAPLGWLLVASSVVEYILASKLPNKVLKLNKKKFNLKRYFSGYYLVENMKIVKREKEIFESILVLALFWSISQVILAIFGEFTKSELNVTNTIYVQGVMALAGIGIVFGSIFVSKLSKYYINLGFVMVGSVGISVVVFLIPFFSSMVSLAILFVLFGILSAFLLVPLNAYIQTLAPKQQLGTILAGNNFIQNIFMVTFLLLTTLFAYLGMDSEILFYIMGFVSLYMCSIVIKKYLVMGFWAIIEMIFRTRHTYIYHGLENIPKDRAVLLLGNHVSWIDWIIVQLPFKRRISFMMDRAIYNWKFLNMFFKKGEAIAVSSKGLKCAFKEAHKRLLDGGMVAIYPEGGISKDGKLGKFYSGYELIDNDYDGVVIPFYIDGIFGSIFSKYKPKNGKLFYKKRVINIYFGESLSKDIKADELKDKIIKMGKKI